MDDTETILSEALKWHDAGKGVALATGVTTWGSSPRRVGAKLAFEEGGALLCSVSGGCNEGAGVTAAQETIRDGKPRLLDFGVTNVQAWEVGLACGGKVQVFVEKLD
jgi:xanthine/CO dehydrogenase XdhC/CoxF family maturation factor